jgi:hypothetical protein
VNIKQETISSNELNIMQKLSTKAYHTKQVVGVILTTDVKVGHFWWWGKIRSDSHSMTNFTYCSQELSQQKARNQFRDEKFS